jgi:hypothetical protein
MKKNLLIAGSLFVVSLSASSQDSLVQNLNVTGFFSNYSSYKLNQLLTDQGIPEIPTNRFGAAVSYEQLFNKWMITYGLGFASGKSKKENITTKSKLNTLELHVGHNLYSRKNLKLYSGVGFNMGMNTVTVFQEPKPTISLNNLLGANNNLIIKNINYNAGAFAKAYLFENATLAPYVLAGYYVPLAKTKWKADEAEITNNVKESPFIFNLTIGVNFF